MNVLFVLNPISGTGRKKLIPRIIADNIDNSRFTYEICYTQYKGHAREIAAEAAKNGVDIVVAVGGDGTVNEIGCGLINTDTAMAILPCGSGNGLARHLGIPTDLRKAVRIINECKIECLDYGMINDRPFFCTCGMGFDAFISMEFAKSGKRGPVTYAEKILKEWLTYKPQTYIITDENNEQKHEALLVSCANASQYGNNAYIAPCASMKDGVMDVVIMEPFNVLDAPYIGMDMFNKTLDRNNKIKTFRTSKLTIKREHEGVVHYDGEPLIMGKDINISIIKGGINVVINGSVQEDVLNSPNIIQSSLNELSHNIQKIRLDFLKTTDEVLQKVNLVKNLKELKGIKDFKGLKDIRGIKDIKRLNNSKDEDHK